MIFAYDHGAQALIVPRADAPGHFAVPVRALQEAGWNVDDATLRRTLPRADRSRLLAGNTSVAAALAAGHVQNGC